MCVLVFVASFYLVSKKFKKKVNEFKSYLFYDKEGCNPVKSIKLRSGDTLAIYDIEKHANGTINTNGMIYNLVTSILSMRDKEGNFVCFDLIEQGGEYFVELKDLKTIELHLVYADIMTCVTNFRFNAFVFKDFSEGFAGVMTEHMEYIRNHVDEIVTICFSKLVEEIEMYSEDVFQDA